MRNVLRELVSLCINEADVSDVSDVHVVPGSTHLLSTCTLDNGKYYLKFSDEDLFDTTDPSLQVLVEYLAYRIYQLYPSVDTPKVDLVFDKERTRVGLASAETKGVPGHRITAEKLGPMMSAGIYVDVFLANWDVSNTSNVIVSDKNVLSRIDPGGALTFRARGGRKGEKFNKHANELKSMLDPHGRGAGYIFKFSDLNVAAHEFLSVSWNQILSTIIDVDGYVTSNLKKRSMDGLSDEWKSDVKDISQILLGRHEVIKKQIEGTV